MTFTGMGKPYLKKLKRFPEKNVVGSLAEVNLNISCGKLLKIWYTNSYEYYTEGNVLQFFQC